MSDQQFGGEIDPLIYNKKRQIQTIGLGSQCEKFKLAEDRRKHPRVWGVYSETVSIYPPHGF